MFNRTRMMQAAGAGGVVEIALTISSDTTDYNIYSNRGGTYEAGNSIITLTINSGIYVGSNSTSTAALIIPSDFDASDEIIVINNGFITGRGGAGGTGGNASGSCGGGGNGSPGGSGGPAISASRSVSITNNGTVAGGGGGGGGGGRRTVCLAAGYCGCSQYGIYRGNGGGGGAGYVGGSAGSHGYSSQGGGASGSAGSKTGGGAGGSNSNMTAAAGSGGGLGAAGGTGASPDCSGAGGGAAGNYATGNSNITWATAGTRLGGVS